VEKQTVAVPAASDGPLEGVSETALGAAEMRAEESLRPDRLIDDPYAAAFVAAAPPLFPDLPSIDDDAELGAYKQAFVDEIAIRTRFFDHYLWAGCASGARQVVLLAAGLDTRAFRLDWPDGVRIFELDLPGLFAFKEQVLTGRRATPRCARTVVPVDLRDDWPTQLTDAGFEPQLASVWAAEGLLAYFSADESVRLLTTVGAMCTTGSQLSFEYDDFVEGSALTDVRAMAAMDPVSSMWKGGLDQPPPAWLASHGWEVQTHARATVATRYERAMPAGTGVGLVTARRR
jgi:methyltransferase (TIGR00027 family)